MRSFAKDSLCALASIMLSFYFTACGSGTKTESNDSLGMKPDLELPVVPDSLTLPRDRAAYAALNFWNGVDFGNDARAADTAFMERHFADFGAMLGLADVNGRQRALTALFERARCNADATGILTFLADKYLGDGNSPVFDEDVYLDFLKQYERVNGTDPVIRQKIELASRNVPGTHLADFSLETREGRQSTLYGELASSETIVMFYDSDCDECRAKSAELWMSPVAQDRQVVAVDVARNRSDWDVAKSMMPQSWKVAFALEDLEETDKYYFSHIPALYIVDATGLVISRNPQLSD